MCRGILPSANVLNGVAVRGLPRREAGQVQKQRRASVVDRKKQRVESL